MQKITYTCDHCGKEIKLTDGGYFDVCINFENTPHYIDDKDLCNDCCDELYQMILRFFEKEVKNNDR